ncbi:MAG: FG-GAP-like repeat-containing protein [Casimicrobiaceae bacterium]
MSIPRSIISVIGCAKQRSRRTRAAGRGLWIGLLWVTAWCIAFPACGALISQVITFAQPVGRIFGGAPFTLAVTASSGLPVVLASQSITTCTVSASTISIAAAGSCTLRASQPGNATYAPAIAIERTFTVAKASQAISFAPPASSTFGSAPLVLTATASSKLGVALATLTSTICTLNANTLRIAGAGDCVVRATQNGNGNFNAAPGLDRTIRITKATQSIAFAAPAMRTYGASPFLVAASATSKLPVSISSSTTSVCTVSGSSASLIAAGTCTLHATQAGDANYSPATAIAQSFTVAKAAQAITFAAPATHVYGDSPFTVSGTASSGAQVSFASTSGATCKISGTTATIVSAGSCSIRASQMGNQNYLAAPDVTRTFGIAKASQSIFFGVIANHAISDATFAVALSSTSHLVVTLVSLTPATCTVAGSSITPVAAGTCTLRALQAGNANFNAASGVTQSFAIAKLTQAIAFAGPQDRTFGDAAFSLTAVASSGLVTTLSSLTPSVCMAKTNQASILAAGICTLRASQAGNARYAPAPNVDRTFAIARAAQLIQFPALTPRSMGEPPFGISAVASSGLPVQLSSTTSAICTVFGQTVTLLHPGSCAINALQPGNANFAAAPLVAQTFAVADAMQTITFDSIADQSLATSSVAARASASSGLTVSLVTTTPSVCSIEAMQITLITAGTCVIRATQAGNTTYPPATPVQRSFAVGLIAQSIAFPPVGEQSLSALVVAALATASSGLPVRLASLAPAVCATSNTNLVSLLAAGTCGVRASQAGNARYAPAADVDVVFNVQQGLSNVVFDPIGAQTLAASPLPLSARSSSQRTVLFSSESKTICTVTGATLDLVAEGICVVTASESIDGIHPSGAPATQRFAVVRTPVFLPAVVVAVGPSPAMVIPGHFRGGDTVDIVVPWQRGISIFANDGHGSFVLATTSTVGALPAFAATGDFNNDNKDDFAVSYIGGNAVGIELGDGKDSFAHPNGWPTIASPAGLVAIDIDGDGNVDLVVANSDSGDRQGTTLASLSGHGDGSMSSAVQLPACDGPLQLVAADLNNDAMPDLAFDCADDDAIGVLLNHAAGNFDFSPSVGSIPAPYRLAAGDLNGDGNIDLVAISRYSISFVLLGDGNGGFTRGSQLSGAGGGDAVIADFNADGAPDIAIANSQTNALYLFAGVGDGSFAAPIVQQTGNYPHGLAVADVDGNGTADLLYTNMVDGTLSILRNGTTLRPVTHIAALSAATQSAVPGTAFASPLAIVVSDSDDRPIAGTRVRFELKAGNEYGVFGSGSRVAEVTTDAHGIAVTPRIRAGITAGTFSAIAHAGSAAITFTLNNRGGGVAPTFTGGASFPAGAIGNAYRYTLVAAGTPDPRFSVTSGTLPPGISLAPDGLLSGTPTDGGTYVGTVTAANGVSPEAQQPFSITISVPTQSIAFNAIADQPLDARAVSAIATASSGLTVSLQSLTPQICTVGGNTIGLLAAGICTVRALQPGNTRYAAALPVERTFRIGRGSQTVALTMPSDARMSAPPAFVVAVASSGLPVTLSTQTPAVCVVVDSEHVRFTSRGVCTVMATQTGTTDFTQAQVSADIQVRGAVQSIFFQPPHLGRLDEYTYLLATASSGLAVTFESLAPEVCAVIRGNAVGVGSNPGAPGNQCTIRAYQAGNDIYDPAFPVSVSFEFGFDPALHAPLPPTPHLVYSRYLGGLGRDIPFDVIAGPDGSAYVGTSVGTTNFPGLSSQLFSNAGKDLLVVSKLDAQSGALNYSVAVGGSTSGMTGTGGVPEIAVQQAMAISPRGEILVASHSNGAEWPQHTQDNYVREGPWQIDRVDGGGQRITIAKNLDPAIQSVRALASDRIGSVYLTGVATAGLMTTAGAAIAGSRVSTSAPYLAKLSSTGTPVYVTYLTVPNTRPSGVHDIGQGKNDAATTGYAITTDADGNAYIAGQATAGDFPVSPGALDTKDNKNRDAFVVKVSPDGSTLTFVARIGFGDVDRATAIALEPDGSIVVAGKSASADDFDGAYAFQTGVHFSQNGMQTLRVDREFGFVAQLDPMATHVNFMAAIGTFGGDLVDHAFEAAPRPLKVAVDKNGSIYAAGTGYPDRTLPVMRLIPGVYDEGAFVMKISSNGGQRYSTFIGEGVATGVSTDGSGNAYVTGYSRGAMPTISAEQAGCTVDVLSRCITPFVTKINDASVPISLSTAVSRVEVGTPTTLVATSGDLSATGTIDFLDGSHLLANVRLDGGVATFNITSTIGIHHYRAIFHGSGYADGMSSPDLMQYTTQKAAP